MRLVVVVKIDRISWTGVVAALSQTATAGVGDFIAAHRTFITGNIDNFDDARIGSLAAHGELDSFLQDSSFLVDAASH